MKKNLLLALLVAPFISFSQIDKIGYSKTQVFNSMNSVPCKNTYDAIWYCGENGSLINYTFKNNLVSSVMYMWEFKSKYEADEDVRNEIAKAKIEYGRPEMKGDQAFWFSGNFLIHISYGYTNGKHYSCWRASER
jgi:hypothetical protein